MQGLTREQSLKLLTDVIAIVNAFDINSQGDALRAARTARSALEKIFGADSEFLEQLTSALRPLIAASSKLDAIKGVLGSAYDEINIFWNGEEMTHTNVRRSSADTIDSKLVFVIHGRQKSSDMHAFLRAIGLQPLEWSQARKYAGSTNPYTWQIVDTALTKAGAIVALMTPDDEARLREDLWESGENAIEKTFLYQPRQNVMFEAGVAYGRDPKRTVLVRIGQHRPMSDLAGHHILQLDNSPESRQAVADALRTAGCPVDLSGSDWFRAGNFG